ncbi:MAG: hypothetical protein ACRDNS_01635, partial [Trebonia sp.]
TGAPPNTRVTHRTINGRRRRATCRFTATGGSSGFQCALVRQTAAHHGRHRRHTRRRPRPRYSRCRSPRAYRHLRRGRYMFYVRAVGAGGADPTPALARFRIP